MANPSTTQQSGENRGWVALTPLQLIAACRARGVQLNAAPAGRIRYVAPKGVIPPELRDQLVAHKPEVLALLVWNPEHAEQHAVDGRRVLEETRRVVRRLAPTTELRRAFLSTLEDAEQMIDDALRKHDLVEVIETGEHVRVLASCIPQFLQAANRRTKS